MTRYHEAKVGRSRFWQIGSFLAKDRREPRYRPERILRERRRREKKKTWAASRECALKGNEEGERRGGGGYGSIISTYNRNVHVRFVSHSRRNFSLFFFLSFLFPPPCFLYLSVCLSVGRWRDAAFTDEKRIREFVVSTLIARQKEFVPN